MTDQSNSELGPDASAYLPEHVLFKVLEEEAVLLNLETGVYFGLDEVGTRIVSQLQKTPALGSVHAALAGEYKVDHDQLWRDLRGFVEEMKEQGLLRVEK